MSYNNGWIKLHRKLLKWEWYDDINVRITFLHCLLKANYEDRSWKGLFVPRGSFVSSLGNLSKEIGISEQNLRTAIRKLKLTNELTSKSTSKNTMFTVVSYNLHQTDNEQTNERLTNNQQTTNKQLTTTKEVKNNKEYKESKLSSLSSNDFEDDTYFQIAKSFYDLFEKNLLDQGAKTGTLKKAKGSWVDDIRLIIESDGYSQEDLRKVFKFLQEDEFWKKNIFSTSKLRKQMDKLIVNANNKNGISKKQSSNLDAFSRVAARQRESA